MAVEILPVIVPETLETEISAHFTETIDIID
jgi:hypothetical protein